MRYGRRTTPTSQDLNHSILQSNTLSPTVASAALVRRRSSIYLADNAYRTCLEFPAEISPANLANR